MPKVISREKCISDFINIHGDEYDYSNFIYLSSTKKGEIVCKIHGSFWQTPANHKSGFGCPTCGIIKSNLKRKISQEQCISQFVSVHQNIYDYSEVNYLGDSFKVKIKCLKHGYFEQTPSNHKKGQGCKKCYLESMKSNKENWLLKFKEKHGEIYNYELSNFEESHIIIICKLHGKFKQSIYRHAQGRGCKKCNDLKNNQKKRLTQEKCILQFKNIHRDLYDYSEVLYLNNNSYVNIKCKKHGIFKQTPANHKQGHGCPFCLQSKGELIIKKYLENNFIEFIYQHTFPECKNKRKLKFDFYLPKYNTCIEYDGIQHFKINNFFGGEAEFNNLKNNDLIKNNYCLKNNIKIIRIPYYFNNNIENILKTEGIIKWQID